MDLTDTKGNVRDKLAETVNEQNGIIQNLMSQDKSGKLSREVFEGMAPRHKVF